MEVAYRLKVREFQFASKINHCHQASCDVLQLLDAQVEFRLVKCHRLLIPKLTNRRLQLRALKQLYQMVKNLQQDDLMDKQLIGSDRFVMEV